MAMSIAMGVTPEDLAEGFDQEPAELAATFVALSDRHIEDEDQSNFLKLFAAAVHDWDATEQTKIHDLVCSLKAAIEGDL
jgi:hypothetical protein